jgi:hypothetical protein
MSILVWIIIEKGGLLSHAQGDNEWPTQSKPEQF